MDFATILSAIGTVGFPIVAFFVCVWALKYAFDAGREDEKRATEQITMLAEAINENTKTLATLVDEIHNK